VLNKLEERIVKEILLKNYPLKKRKNHNIFS